MEVTPEIQQLLDRREAEVTRSVTSSVTADLALRHQTELALRDRRIAQLEQENGELHEQLQDMRLRLERVERHPAVRLVRSVRRRLRDRN